MKILNIPNFYYPNIGGIEQVARDFSRVFSEKGVAEQKVLCTNRNGKKTVRGNVDGVDVTYCGCTAMIRSQAVSADYPGELRKLMNEFHPDVVVLHYPNPFQLFFLMRHAKKDFRFILYWHSDIVRQKWLGRLFIGLEKKAAERADLIITASRNCMEGSRTLKSYREKCRVVPYCIDPSRFELTPAVTERISGIRKKHEGKVLCFAFGRHVPYKGFEVLNEAKKYLPENIDVVIGDRLSQDELTAYLHTCDIFCFPSITKNEAFGLGLAEGMLFGHPAVTFTIPGSGVNYVSPNGITGIECPNGDAKAYAEAIMKLADDRELRERLGRNARERVLNHFTFEHYKENIYETVVSAFDNHIV